MQQHQSAQQKYLQAEVHTATPQKLQLMLVEAAIKNIHRTKLSWQQQRYDDGVETLSRSQDIIAEILCSLDVKSNEQIAKSLGAIYLFVFRCLAEGGMKHDEQKLDDALRVLNAERETWRQVCEKFGSSTDQAVTNPVAGSGTSSQSVDYKPSGAPATYSNNANIVAGKAVGGGNGGKISTFTQGIRPLGASPIQTNSSLAQQKSQTQTAPPSQEKPASVGGSSWDA